MKFSDYFNVVIQSEAQDYLDQQGVKVLNINRPNSTQPDAQFLTQIEFHVRGTQYYKTQVIQKTSNLFELRCNCELFKSGYYCKHALASFLKLTQDNLIEGVSYAEAELAQHPLIHVLLEAPTTTSTETSATESSTSENSEKDAFDWKLQIQSLRHKSFEAQKALNAPAPEKPKEFVQKAVHFAVDITKTLEQKKIILKFYIQEYLLSGVMGLLKPAEISQNQIKNFANQAERDLLWEVLGHTELHSSYNSAASFYRGVESISLNYEFALEELRNISRQQKLLFFKKNDPFAMSSRARKNEVTPYSFAEYVWQYKLMLKKIDSSYFLLGLFTDHKDVKRAHTCLGMIDQMIFFEEFMALTDIQDKTWYELFTKTREIEIPESEIDAFLEFYFADKNTPPIDLPEDLHFTHRESFEPQVFLSLSGFKESSLLQAHLYFIYEENTVPAHNPSSVIYDIKKRQKIQRNLEFEKSILEKFKSLEPRNPKDFMRGQLDADGVFTEKALSSVVEKAASWGWQLEVHKRKVQVGGPYKMNISSGMDWFDVQAEFQFDQLSMSLPQLIQNIKSGEKLITLKDGSLGLIPNEWINKLAPLTEMAQKTENGLRLNKVQALFLSSSFEENETEFVQADRKFNQMRKLVSELQNIKAKDPGEDFQGKLRTYQKKGLGWLSLISEYELGGILADDMGLGKTIQILSLLASQPRHKAANKKSKKCGHLIVAPKSLIFNWTKESEKFTPHFKILNFTGTKRQEYVDDLHRYDIILTTYQSLRQDIEILKHLEFNFFILDEAHYIKNPDAQASIACKQIQAQKKISLTGTPVENSLNDLFSILSVVTPGLIKPEHAQKWSFETDRENLSQLSRALRPFILRRTKEAVLKDLPEKSEQILYCELSSTEKAKYDELKAFYWNQLNGKLKEKGLAQSKIEVLEALLRLRQAACHQGLLSDKYREASSSKFDLLLEQLQSVIQDGHKALIFSQFTSLLELFKNQLEQKNISYEYLDGQTSDRQERVERFQKDESIKVFLLSLKAGGVGLNLTSADYVFILDPWWNPAAEAQAIDRAHRIGQNRKVFAYKIIAKDTVEEKILELQKTKKELAKSVISDEKSVLKSLKFEDLQALFN